MVESDDGPRLEWRLARNCSLGPAQLFVAYLVLGHGLAASGASDGVARLGAAMAIAFFFVLPFGFGEAIAAFRSPLLLAAAAGVGLCSSVIPYICDQLAMSRLPRTGFALLLSLLPVSATLIGVIVLKQIPSPTDLAGIALVVFGVAIHKPAPMTANLPPCGGDVRQDREGQRRAPA